MDCPQKIRHFLGAFLFMGESKYRLEFKVSCVEKINKNDLSIHSVAQEVGLDASIVRKWK